MIGVKEIAAASKDASVSVPLPVFYSFRYDDLALNMKDPGYFKITELTKESTEEDIMAKINAILVV